jgi:hypothetical protein
MKMQHLIGKVVTFSHKIEDMESYAEGGMRARIVSIEAKNTGSPDLHDHIYKIMFDFGEFDKFNRRFESSNYYDKNGSPTLNAREAGYYKEQEAIYFGSPGIWPFEDYFVLADAAQTELLERFKASGETDYVTWLESQVLSQTAEG